MYLPYSAHSFGTPYSPSGESSCTIGTLGVSWAVTSSNLVARCKNRSMKRFLVGTVINALGLWAVTALVPAIKLVPYGGADIWSTILSYLLVGLIFGLVNAIIAPVIKIVALPLYLLTFGLISLVINGALLLFVAWLSSLLDGGTFSIDGFTTTGLSIESFGWAILGALIMSFASFISRGLFKVLRIL